MFNVEKYIKIARSYLECDNDGRITVHIDVNIDDDKIHKEIEEFYESLRNLHKVLGYDFILIVNENDIIFKKLEVN